VQFKQYYGKILSMIEGLGLSPQSPPGNYAYVHCQLFAIGDALRLGQLGRLSRPDNVMSV